MAKKERILIVVKTYPTISKKHVELSCTAGMREDGSWVRLYPIPFRLLPQEERYKKYQWIEIRTEKNKKDHRLESCRPLDSDDKIKLLEEMGTSNKWEERKKIVLEKNKVYTNLGELIELAHQNKLSLAVFKPSKIIDFVCENAESSWPQDKENYIYEQLKQLELFSRETSHSDYDFKLVRKLPIKFSYTFEDDSGSQSTLMIEDWEIGQLYWNCLERANQNSEEAIQKVRQKYFDEFINKKDLYFFLGTTLQWHVRKASNPYIIIGTFYPPCVEKPTLF